ncbi:phage tail sheath subtilisin-like domain-containing protein [Salimicrobium halophilum]|uniref:Phage tail sheath protein n=1 Tax=Salimicrobium halophilum TaxID=86666 RepID=A0A1G8WDM9_9BACI|nr:phage tail sheath subtilisin-like domain-containing protein [Salimicrobium halophilum]SDJ76247.1 Phage tail sheath protein [Salimicrobium halophilum]
MGLPDIFVEFRTKGVTAVERSSKGVVALILEESAPTHTFKSYGGIDEVTEADWSADNYDLISKTFMGNPRKVMIQTIDTGATEPETTVEAIGHIKNKKWNYLATPYATTTTDVASFITGERTNNHKTFKAVLANEVADHEGVINFTASNIVVGGNTYTTEEYTARIAGILAGLPFTRSATYLALNEVDSVDEVADPDTAIDNGEFILIDDGEVVKVGRGVNSLTSTTQEKGEQFKKITIIDKLDQMRDDIRDTFESEYVGKVLNVYNNKMLLFSAITAYFSENVREGILDPDGENRAELNFSAQKNYLQGKGVAVEDMKDQEIREYNTDTHVFGRASVRVTDAMEDLDFDIAI